MPDWKFGTVIRGASGYVVFIVGQMPAGQPLFTATDDYPIYVGDWVGIVLVDPIGVGSESPYPINETCFVGVKRSWGWEVVG